MFNGLKVLDRVLRGESTQLPALSQGRIDVPTLPLLRVLLALGIVAGACTGLNAVITRYYQSPQHVADGWMQMMASAIKVPLLFGLTLIITFPSLYVFNALVGSRLNMLAMLRLLVMALSVMMAVVASLGPIIAFFAACTTSYPFMKLLNVVAYGLSGLLGLGFLLQTLHRLSAAEEAERLKAECQELQAQVVESDDTSEGVPPPPSALSRIRARRRDPRVATIFRIWVIVFGLVGAQMAWVLRPFIGNPDQPFSFFRPRESNFFEAVWLALGRLFGSW